MPKAATQQLLHRIEFDLPAYLNDRLEPQLVGDVLIKVMSTKDNHIYRERQRQLSRTYMRRKRAELKAKGASA